MIERPVSEYWEKKVCRRTGPAHDRLCVCLPDPILSQTWWRQCDNLDKRAASGPAHYFTGDDTEAERINFLLRFMNIDPKLYCQSNPRVFGDKEVD